jgi:hypothetical protein
MYIILYKSDDQIVWDYIFRFSVRSRWSGDELEPQVILVAGFNPLKKCSPLGIVIPTDGLLHSMDHRVECPVLLDWMDRSRSENNLGSWHALQHRQITTVKQISKYMWRMNLSIGLPRIQMLWVIIFPKNTCKTSFRHTHIYLYIYIYTHRIHVWYIWLHLPTIYPKC